MLKFTNRTRRVSHVVIVLIFSLAIGAWAEDLRENLSTNLGWKSQRGDASLATAEAFDLNRVRLLDGPFKRIQELHRTGLVRQLEPDKLLFPFRRNAGLPQPAGVKGGYGGWDEGFISGHYGGHYLSAAARMYAATGDTSFRDKANYMVKALIECQEKLGGRYLSAFPATQFDRDPSGPALARCA
ncbi:MAG TPA: glycoside hydrolase family 127 protein [Candidatus Paceibacterota bacterium]|nr:glycoside hydrolase family 127 protein [Verrucomicrobiota bacterium]HRY50762.1 glycoside hydrolase family 127 protein [Candidatus Paceibacterota bacterium]